MKSSLKHPMRVSGRILWLGAEFLLAAIRYAGACGLQPAETISHARANWLRASSKRVLRVFGAEIDVTGKLPSSGLLVCNHLSYLDVLLLASLAPCVFVAKSEVKCWPVFGWFARLAGTIFVNRDKRSQAATSAHEIERALRTGALVVLFPEGTSSGGDSVLPFKSSLLDPATRIECPLDAGFIAYELRDGDAKEEVCYWKDMTLVPHLINLLSKRSVRASVRFASVNERSRDRKELARQLHSEVSQLNHQMAAGSECSQRPTFTTKSADSKPSASARSWIFPALPNGRRIARQRPS